MGKKGVCFKAVRLKPKTIVFRVFYSRYMLRIHFFCIVFINIRAFIKIPELQNQKVCNEFLYVLTNTSVLPCRLDSESRIYIQIFLFYIYF